MSEAKSASHHHHLLMGNKIGLCFSPSNFFLFLISRHQSRGGWGDLCGFGIIEKQALALIE
jgi:hypothetical protein